MDFFQLKLFEIFSPFSTSSSGCRPPLLLRSSIPGPPSVGWTNTWKQKKFQKLSNSAKQICDWILSNRVLLITCSPACTRHKSFGSCCWTSVSSNAAEEKQDMIKIDIYGMWLFWWKRNMMKADTTSEYRSHLDNKGYLVAYQWVRWLVQLRSNPKLQRIIMTRHHISSCKFFWLTTCRSVADDF